MFCFYYFNNISPSILYKYYRALQFVSSLKLYCLAAYFDA